MTWKMEETRPVLKRSMLILFTEELSSSDRTGRPVETEEIQTRSSEDSKSLNVEQTHDRTGRPVTNTIAVQDDPQVCHEADTLNVDDEVHHKRMEKSIVVHDENHELMMVNEEDMDFRIPGLPHSVVKHAQSTSVRQWIQKIENHPHRHALQQDLRQNQPFNPFSPESKQMIRDVRNIDLCELLETEPKTQCKVCLSYWNTGIVYCMCGHFLRKGREENQQFIKYTMDLLSIPEYVIKKGRPHGHRYGQKPGDREYFSANQLKKKCKKKFVQGIHDRFIRDETFRNRVIENGRDEDVCRQWDALADEDHTHHLTPQEYYHYKSNWWLHSNKTGSNTVPVEHRPDFKQALSTLQQLKQKEEEAQRNQRWAQSPSSSSWWSWQGSWWTPYSYKVTMEMNQVLIKQGDLLYKYLEQFFKAWFSWIQLLCYRCIVYSWRRSTVTDGRCTYNTSNDMFSRCKSVHKMATEKSDDQLIQPDNKLELGTSYKLKLGPRWNWDQKWKIKNWPWMRGDNARCVHQWQHDHFYWLPHCLSVSAHCSVSSCVLARHITRTPTVAQVMSLSSHPHVHVHAIVSPRLALSFFFTHFLPHSFNFLLHLKFVDYNLLRTPHNESMDLSDDFLLSTGYEPNAYDFKETSVEPYTELLNRRRSSPTESLLRTPTTMTLHSRVCFAKLTEYIAITLYEKTCLSGCCRRQCPIERGDPLEIERGRPVEQGNQEAQIRTLLDKQKEQILCRVPGRN